jgi:hypothetical protein
VCSWTRQENGQEVVPESQFEVMSMEKEEKEKIFMGELITAQVDRYKLNGICCSKKHRTEYSALLYFYQP